MAYLRLIGHTQAEAAKAAGVGERTIRTWESQASWVDAEAEARSRWLQGGDRLVMKALYRGLEADDQATARWWAQRRLPEFGGRAGPSATRSSLGGGTFGIVITPEHLASMSDEQLEALDTALALAGAPEPPSDDPGGGGGEPPGPDPG